MKPARITNEAAQEFISGLTDIDGTYFPDGLNEPSIDQLIEEIDRELEAEARTARSRVLRPFADVERARRSQRRREREALRALPSRWDVADLDGEAA